MPQTFIKYFFITLCSIYIYFKLANKKISISSFIFSTLFLLVSTTATCFVRYHFAFGTLYTIAILGTVFFMFLFKEKLNKALCFYIISFCMSFLLYLVSLIIYLPVSIFFIKNLTDITVLDSITLFIIGIIQIFVTFFLFKIKRFKSGLPNLGNTLSSDLGIIISIFLLTIASFIYNNKDKNLLYIVIFIIIFFCSTILFFWYKNQITYSYLKKVYDRNIEMREHIIAEMKGEIDNLRFHNDEMSKIIHKDNKLIPAMKLAVNEFISPNHNLDINEKEHAQGIINQIEAIESERMQALNNYEFSTASLSKTGVASTDSILNFLKNLNSKDTLFNINVNCDVKYLTEHIISENDLNVLISDLGENAIISVYNQEHKEILISLDMTEDFYILNIYDSGSEFDVNVISNLGIRRYTTRKKTGGSGIGLMTICEIIKKYNASLEINECLEQTNFTKSISIVFDNLSEYRIKTYRNNVIKVCKARNDFIILP